MTGWTGEEMPLTEQGESACAHMGMRLSTTLRAPQPGGWGPPTVNNVNVQMMLSLLLDFPGRCRGLLLVFHLFKYVLEEYRTKLGSLSCGA